MQKETNFKLQSFYQGIFLISFYNLVICCLGQYLRTLIYTFLAMLYKFYIKRECRITDAVTKGENEEEGENVVNSVILFIC